MIREKISQREAYRLRKALRKANEDYVALTNRFKTDFPGVLVVSTMHLAPDTFNALAVAQRLGFCLVAKVGEGVMRFYAVRPK